MSFWLGAGLALLCGLFPLGVASFRGNPYERLVVIQMAGVILTLALLVLAEGYDRDIYFDLAVVLAMLSFAGSLVYVRSLERWA